MVSSVQYGGGSELEESVELERGQNLLQFHVTQVHTLIETPPSPYYTLLFFFPSLLPPLSPLRLPTLDHTVLGGSLPPQHILPCIVSDI